jgi:hypothetical protein
VKALSILQMIFGVLASFSAWQLLIIKAHINTPTPAPGNGMLVSSQPPNTIFEFSLLFFGLAIIICGLFQRRKKVQNTSIQLISGLVISGISGFLTIRAIGKGYGEVSGLYYIAYLPLVLGILVFVMGVIQLIHHEGTNAK